MMDRPNKLKQIEAILYSANIGYVEWSEKNLGMSWIEMRDKYDFTDVFDISVDEVYEFVKQHGWNYFYAEYPELRTLVSMAPELPADYAKTKSIWLFLPLEEKGYPLVKSGSYDKSPWDMWYFKTEKDRDIGLINELFKIIKRSFERKYIS